MVPMNVGPNAVCPKASNIPLAMLPVGSRGIITNLMLKGMTRRRLMDLGMVPGTAVKAVRRSPVGDPTAFLIRGTLIALRREESVLITVYPIQE